VDGDRDGAARRAPRRCRVILYVVGGLLGPGYWLCGVVWDGRLFGKSPAEARFTEFVLASVVVVVASWGLLLILGEAMLFALAVFKADDRERYDIYRNLMILWGYVLTLGIPRHFRKLPAQFGARPDDVRSGARGRGGQGGGGSQRRSDRPAEHRRRDGTHHHGGGPAQERQDQRGTGAPRRQESRDRRDRDGTRDRRRDDECRDHTGCDEHPGEHVGCRHVDSRDRTSSRENAEGRTERDRAGKGARDRQDPAGPHGSRDREDARQRAAPRERPERGGTARTRPPVTGPGEQPASRDGERTEPPGTSVGPREGAARRRKAPRGAGERKPAASVGTVPGEHPAPLGPIFPPRPAAEAEPGPVPEPPAALGPAAVTVSSLADTLPAGDTELRNALELLLRYAARCEGGDGAVPCPALPDPEIRDSAPFGIAADAGGDV
jgi:hypothetical protein